MNEVPIGYAMAFATFMRLRWPFSCDYFTERSLRWLAWSMHSGGAVFRKRNPL